MDKQAAGGIFGPVLNSLGRAIEHHPRIATGIGSVGAGAGGYYAGKKLLAPTLDKRTAGKATFGDIDDRYQKGSYASTFNPISSVMGGVDKVPEWYVKMFPNTTEGLNNAHMTFKAGAVGLLAAALVGGYRAAKHYTDMDELQEQDRPGKNLAGQLSTTFEGDMMPKKKKKKKEDQKKTAGGRIHGDGVFTWRNFFGTAIPLGATLLAASVAESATDNYFDKRRNKALDEAIANKEDAIKQLIATRARMAKGLGTKSEIGSATQDLENRDVYVKDASVDKEAMLGMNDLLQHFGATTAAVILASALGSYAYTSASDENNVKFRAYRKALNEYAKNKSGITPITIAPTDAKSYFDYINGEKEQKKVTPREQPELDSDSLNKPISISI